MSDLGFGQLGRIKSRTGSQILHQGINWQTKLAGLLVLILLCAPRSRIVIGAPLYFIDVLAFVLLISPLHGSRFSWVPRQPFSQIIQVYLAFVVVSELRGMLAYGTLIESIYMAGRFIIAGSVFYTLPRLISSAGDMNPILKGIVVGTLLSAIIVIMYSLGPLRPLVMNTVYSSPILNPGWENLLRVVQMYGAGEVALRGRSLVGAATLTAGFIASFWPLSFLAYSRFEHSVIWKRIALVTTIVAPVGVLMTYGRGAWAMVGVILILVAVFGMASARKIFFMAVMAAVILFSQFNINANLFMLDRVVKSTQRTLNSPFADVSSAERLFSYVEPFAHLVENPIWLLAGSGRAGSRESTRDSLAEVGGQLYDEGGRATHSAFAMAYYSFGFIAALCQVLLIVKGFLFIFSRMRMSQSTDKEQKIIWQSLFMSWTAYTLWWGSGHGMVGEARGAMVTFLMIALLVAFEKLRIMQLPSRSPVRKTVAKS